MDHRYEDMYSLFRHDRNAKEFFDELPSYLQDQIRPRYQNVDTFDRLLEYADRLRRTRQPS